MYMALDSYQKNPIQVLIWKIENRSRKIIYDAGDIQIYYCKTEKII